MTAVDITTTDNRDLVDLPATRWDRLDVPEGWEPIADICREIKRNLAASVRDTVEAIRSEVALYRRSSVPKRIGSSRLSATSRCC